MNAPTPALVARPERLRLVGQRRQILAVMHQRLMIGMLIYGGIVALIVLRLVYLAAFGDHAGRKGGALDLAPERGDVVDRDGQSLAVTIDAWTIGIQPAQVIGDKFALAQKLAVLMPEKDAATYLGDAPLEAQILLPPPPRRAGAGRRDQRAWRARHGAVARARPALSADRARRACARLHRRRRQWQRRDRARLQRPAARPRAARHPAQAVDLQPDPAGARA